MPCPDDSHCGYPDQLEDKIERLETVRDQLSQALSVKQANVERLEAAVAQHLASIEAMVIDEARWAEVERLDAAIRADKACGDG